MNEKSMVNDMTQGNLAKQLFTYTLPLVLASILQMLYNVVDMIVVGQFVGSAGLSGVSIGGEILNLVTFTCMGFANAGQIIISQYVGLNDRDSISKTIGTLFSVILILAVAFTVIGLVGTDFFLGLLNTPAEAWTETQSYVTICFSGLIFIFGYNAVSAMLRGMGDSKKPMYFVAMATVINVVFDLIFVAGMDMGAAGAAIATVMGQAFSFIVSLIYLYIRRKSFGFDFKLRSFAIRKQQLLPLVKLGFPMALQSSAISISMLVVNANVNAYGVIASSVTGVGGRLKSVVAIVTHSFCTSTATLVGQNFAAGKFGRARKAVHLALLSVVAYAAICSVILLLFPRQAFGLFSTDPDVIELGLSYVPCMLVAFGSFSLMAPYNGFITGIGHVSLNFIISILDGVVVRIGLSLLLGKVLNYGLMGFWYGNELAGYVTVILAAAYFYFGAWRKRSLLVGKRAEAVSADIPEETPAATEI